VDPISGIPTIYPALFHTFWGQIKSLFSLDTLRTMQWIGAVSLLGLFLGFYFMATAFVRNRLLACAAAMCLILVVYAPTGRYILLQNPANFSFVFLFASFGFLGRYLRSGRGFELNLGGLLAGLAINFWWFHVVAVAAFLSVFFMVLIVERRLHARLVPALLFFLSPFLFTLVHLVAIGDVLANYRSATSVSPFKIAMLRTWLGGIISKGNFQFSEWLKPFSLAFIHFYFIVLPFSGLALIASVFIPVRAWMREKRVLDRKYFWVYAAWLVFILSLVVLMVGNFTHLRRVQFVGFAFLLVFLFQLWDEKKSAVGGRGLAFTVLLIASLISYFYLFSAIEFDAQPGLPPAQQKVIQFVRSLQNHAETRMFVDEKGLRRLIPFVRCKGFVSYTHGGYYGQDPLTADGLFRSYRACMERRPNWRQILAAWKVKYLIFFLQADQITREAAEFYKERCVVLSASPDWLILEMRKP
jgi:hypothetical protein